MPAWRAAGLRPGPLPTVVPGIHCPVPGELVEATVPLQGVQGVTDLDVASEHFHHYVGGLGKDMVDGEKAIRTVYGVNYGENFDEATTDAGSPFSGSEPEAERYQPLSDVPIGSGAYGTVLAAWDRETNERVALKRISLEDDQDGVPAHIIREVSLLLDLAHRNVVQLRDLQVLRPTEFQLVLEYVPDELHRTLKSHRRAGTQLPMALVHQYSQDLLRGIHACHVLNIMHRDLKPQNILIHAVDGLKICDFGLARGFSQPVRMYTPEVVTLWYRCPELLLGHGEYGPEVDIWSAGCILAEIATSHPTFPGDSEIGTVFKIMELLGSPTEATWPGFEQILKHWSPRFPRWSSTDLSPIRRLRPELGEAGLDLIRALLVMNPASRLTVTRARRHAFLQQGDAPAGPPAT